MALENIMKGLIPFVAILVGAAGEKSTVNLTISVSGSQSSRNVQFTEELFKQFHQCMCTDTTINCTATFSSQDLQVESIRNTTLSPGDMGKASSFSCGIDNEQDGILQCTRLQYCNTAVLFLSTSYYLPSADSCTFSCVGILWKDGTESLNTSTDHGFIEFNQCNDYCSKTGGTSVTSTHRKSISTTTTTTTSTTAALTKTNTKFTVSDNSSHTTTPETSARTTDDNTDVIIGVVVGVLLVIIIAVIVVVVILRRRRHSNESKSANHRGLDTVEAVNSTVNEEIDYHCVSDRVVLPRKSSTFRNTVEIDKNINSPDHYSATPSSSTTVRMSASTKTPSYDSNTDTDKYYNVAKALDDNLSNNGTVQISNGHLNKENRRKYDGCGYAKVQMSENTYQATDSQEDSQDKEKTANDLNKIFIDNFENMLENKNDISEKNTGQDMEERDHQVSAGDVYEYAVVDNDESVSNGQVRENDNIDNRIFEESTDDEYGYSGIDLNNGGTVTNFVGVQSKQNREINHDDYQSTESVNPYDAITTEEQEDPTTTHGDGITDSDYNTVEESQYSDLGNRTPKSKNIYSKLGDNVKEITDPYNVLLHAKEDPKTRKPLPDPAFSTPATNGQSRYSFAHPLWEESANPVEVINVDLGTSTEHHATNDTSAHRINNEMSTVDRVAPDYAVVSKKQTTNSPFSDTRPETDKGPHFTLQANDEERPRANVVPEYPVVNETRAANKNSRANFGLEQENSINGRDYDVGKSM